MVLSCCRISWVRLAVVASILALVAGPGVAAERDPLPSWNDGAAKAAIMGFVARITAEGGPDFVPPDQRIATFDNDGTLWSEQPAYVQAAFLMDRLKAMAPQHPEWRTEQPYKAALDGDHQTLAAGGLRTIDTLVMATHAGMTSDEFTAAVTSWIATARHPRFNRPYTDLVYQPMVELVAYLKEQRFKVYIVSGGGVEFMRPWTETIYGIPPEQVVGSSIKLKYELSGDSPLLRRLPEIDFIDDGPGKPVGIARAIGRRPIFAAGNSDGDLQMLQWTTLAPGPRFALLVHHTDAEREWAYDRTSAVGKLDKALDEAPGRGWLVVDMKADWKAVFPFQR
ncbi:HAD family hydrolase [Azospirillum soli]|uniref:HAD family hydrolase n=1 Tax=Azospirillum soli TaxID=1304799 RepID=UPI001AE38D7F|nr:HAD family hydrolase [Azospirillum soli]MBP2312640.1 phosphoglycolate phosphatase-like HAD superfamily hydrolase [Azospirillum soli]